MMVFELELSDNWNSQGTSPASVSGEGTTIPGTTRGAILGAAGKVTDSDEPEKEDDSRLHEMVKNELFRKE